MAASKHRLTRKEFKTNLKRQMDQRSTSQAHRHVTAHQIYSALHDLVFQFDAPISVDQVLEHILKTDETVSQNPLNQLRREIVQVKINE